MTDNRADDIAIAKAHKGILWLIPATFLAFVFPPLFLVIAVIQGVLMYRLADALRLSSPVAWTVGSFVPIINLLVVLAIHYKSLNVLRRHGFMIGFMGARVPAEASPVPSQLGQEIRDEPASARWDHQSVQGVNTDTTAGPPPASMTPSAAPSPTSAAPGIALMAAALGWAGVALCWLSGVLFLFVFLGRLSDRQLGPAFFALLHAAVLLPPVYVRIEHRIGHHVRGQRAIIAAICVVALGMAIASKPSDGGFRTGAPTPCGSQVRTFCGSAERAGRLRAAHASSDRGSGSLQADA